MFGIYKAPAAYDLIDEESSYEKNNVLGSNKGKGHRGPSTLMPWLLAILFAASTAYLLWKDLTLQYTGTFETGFNHELGKFSMALCNQPRRLIRCSCSKTFDRVIYEKILRES
jgi:hypothetical protein